MTHPHTISRFRLTAGKRRVALMALCVGLLAGPALAEESPNSTLVPVAGNGEHDLVLRVTKQHFDDLTRDEFHETVPVERQFLLARVSGTAHVEGRVKVEMETDEDEAVFLVTLDGEVRTTTVSSARSLRIHSSGTTTYHAQKRVLFDGVAYRGQPTTVSLTHDSHVGQIASTRRGILGRLVVRIAQRIVPKMAPEVSRTVEREARTLIRNEFDQIAGELIVELNKTTPIEETIMRLFPETETWVYDLSTTDQYIQAGVGPKGLRFPELPKRAEGRRHDPVELWIRTEDAKARADVLKMWSVAQEVLATIAPENADLPEPIRGQATAEQVGDWVVITIGKASGR